MICSQLKHTIFKISRVKFYIPLVLFAKAGLSKIQGIRRYRYFYVKIISVVTFIIRTILVVILQLSRIPC